MIEPIITILQNSNLVYLFLDFYCVITCALEWILIKLPQWRIVVELGIGLMIKSPNSWGISTQVGFFPWNQFHKNVFFSCEINFTIFCSLNHVFSKLKMLLQVYVCLLVNSMVLYVLKWLNAIPKMKTNIGNFHFIIKLACPIRKLCKIIEICCDNCCLNNQIIVIYIMFGKIFGLILW